MEERDIDEDLLASTGTPAAMDELGFIMADLELAEAEVDDAEVRLAQKKAVVNAILCNTLPAAMAAAGVEELKRPDGQKIKLKDVVKASIKGREPEAIEWLEDNGEGHQVKRNVTVRLPKGADTAELKRLIESQGVTPEETLKVEPSTLRAMVTRWMEEGREFPHELFGAERYTIARISK